MLINIIVIIFFIISIAYTIKYKAVQFKAIKEAGKTLKRSKTSYQTFMVSLASHIGTGNIVGIAAAIIYGGAGSIFWMWIFAITTSIFSLIENTLSQVYKVKIDGENRGGSCYYVYYGLKNKILASLIAIFLVLSNTIFFQPLQVNTISDTINLTFGLPKIYILIILLIFTFFFIFKGTKRIVSFCEVIVPVMSIGYIAITLLIIILNINQIPHVINKIFVSAFDFKSILGGFGASALTLGMKRSLFSHEAGLGTMPTISAMSDVDKPIEQGFVLTIGVFVDTIVICSLTAFVILIYDIDFTSFSGCDLVLSVFFNSLGNFGVVIGIFFLLVFALATIVSEYYLGESNLLFLSSKNKTLKIVYKLLFVSGIFMGVFLSTKNIWEFVDYGMIILGLCNLYAIFKLRKVFEKELINYF